eukprot:scaffold92931_cov17-Tisochrysis_lutea.AAC.1
MHTQGRACGALHIQNAHTGLSVWGNAHETNWCGAKHVWRSMARKQAGMRACAELGTPVAHRELI